MKLTEEEKFLQALFVCLSFRAPDKETYDLFYGIFPENIEIENPFKLT